MDPLARSETVNSRIRCLDDRILHYSSQTGKLDGACEWMTRRFWDIANWVCFVKLLRIDRTVSVYSDVGVHSDRCRDPLSNGCFSHHKASLTRTKCPDSPTPIT